MAFLYVCEFPFHDHFSGPFWMACCRPTHVSSTGSILHHSHHYCFLTGCSILTCTLQLYALSTSVLDFDWRYFCWRFWITFSMVIVFLTVWLRNCFDSGQKHYFIFSRTSRLTLGRIHLPIQWVKVTWNWQLTSI